MTIATEGYRAFDLEGSTHDVDEAAHEVVVHFPFEQMDSYRSDFAPGWCDDYLKSHRPVMVVHHNPRDLIGRMKPQGYRNLGDKAELVGKFSDFDSNPLAREYFGHIRDDEIPGWSFHYRNGRGIPHPSGVRGAVRYTKADMPEFGPTPFPAIPGAGVAGLRSEEPTLYVPTISELLELGKTLNLDSDGIRSLVAEHHPTLVEHITIGTPAPKLDVESLTSTVTEQLAAGNRAMSLHIADDGSVSTSNDTDDDAKTLVQAIDAALDHACASIGDTDLTTLPDNVQQAIGLMEAAGAAVDELQVVLGIPDPDDPDGGNRSEWEMEQAEGNRAVLGTKDRNDLPDSAFAYIEPGGKKDDEGKTVPRSKRHFPIQDAEHVRNALARIGQGAAFSDEAKQKVLAAAKKFKIDVPDDSGNRSHAEEAAAALARLRSE